MRPIGFNASNDRNAAAAAAAAPSPPVAVPPTDPTVAADDVVPAAGFALDSGFARDRPVLTGCFFCSTRDTHNQRASHN